MKSASYQLLSLLGQTLDGVEHERKAAENRYRSFTAEAKNPRDTAKGFAGTPEADYLKGVYKHLHKLEKELIRKLEDATLAISWVPAFLDARVGVAPKGLGRLLGALGDPLWNDYEGRERRGYSEVWAFAGYHTVPAASHQADAAIHTARAGGGNVRPRRRRGVKINWNPRVKTAAYVLAQFSAREAYYYHPVYLTERQKAASKVHVALCRNSVRPPGRPNGCGVGAHPEWGEPGSPWRPGHQLQHAKSMVAKQVLKDVFLEARRVGA